MRWFIDVAVSSQKDAPEQWVVEASQWQPALQAARALRGDPDTMSGFSIELLEDGYRAIDPGTMIRYVVRRAPDGTPVSRPSAKGSQLPPHDGNGSAGARATSSSGSQPPVSKADRIAALLDIGAGGGSASKAPGARTVGVGSSVTGGTRGAPELVPPRPLSQPAARPGSASQVPAAPRPGSHPPVSISQVPPAPRPVSVAPAAFAPPPPSVAPPVGVPPMADSLPPADLLFQREEDPSPASPLTYRETAWVVPEGTSIEAAVRLTLGMFEGVRSALAHVPPGKLVNMAVFDHRFQGKPLRPPLATLTWKDWKDQGQGPEIRRRGEPPVSMAPGISLAPPAPGAVGVGIVPAAPAVPSFPASASPSVAPAPPTVPAASSTAPAILPPVAAPLAAEPIAAAPPVAAAAPGAGSFPLAAPPAPVGADLAPRAPSSPPVSALPTAPEPAPPPAAAPSVAPPSVAPPRALSSSSSSLNPPPPRSSTPSVPRVRLSGDELIVGLFEVMHDLHFLRDSLDGADFVLSLVMEKLPCKMALVHFYDIDAREFVVVRTAGKGAAKALQVRTSEKDSLISEVMRKRRSVVIADAGADPRVNKGRWALLDIGNSSLVCAPVEQGGRFLGFLELSNPRDGIPFKEGDGHALTYIGEQFAEFLATRGVVLDPDRIGSR